MESMKIEIGDLFEFLNLNNDKYDETQYSEQDIYVKTDKGDLTPILGYVKKQDKPIYKCRFETNETIRVADTHIFRTNNEEIFAKDSKGKLLDTLKGQVRCTDVTYDGVEDVYDISIEDPHWYTHDEDFANGLISHNTLHMASWAMNAFINGFNVAIFSMEDGELGYASRLDANLMNTTLAYMKEKALAMNTTFESVINDNLGQIKIKEYPTGMPTVNNFRAVLQDWKIKEGFIPDIIFIDYINIMQSVKNSSNGYENGKHVAEDIRGLGVELNIPVVTATQGNRCLVLDTVLIKENDEHVLIKDIKVGDKILSNNGYVEVKYKTKPKKMKTYKITLKSGKTIICSEKHLFPTNNGELSIETGLKQGHYLKSI